MKTSTLVIVGGLLSLLPLTASAQGAPATPRPDAADSAQGTPTTTAAETSTPPATTDAPAAATTPAAESSEDAERRPAVEFHGAIEANWSYNFNEPSNGVTNWRFYDTRHNLIGLQNAWLTTAWNLGPTSGHVELQLGAFHELFWPSERSLEEDLLWRLIQEATAEWQTPWQPLSIEAGVYNVPFGPEYNQVHKNWHWSTSNIFAMMPYQIAGARANLDLGRGWVTRLGVYNGWDRIVTDNNSAVSVMAAVEYEDPDDEENYFVFEYMVGNERDRDDELGPYARHTFDLYGQWHLLRPFTVRGHVFAGVEPGRMADEAWLGVALSAKVDVTSWFAVSARGDVVRTFAGSRNIFHSEVLDDPARSTLLGSATLTLDVHPARFASLRLEARHDRADFPLFYGGNVPVASPMLGGGALTTESDQTTVTLGLTTWF